jgi:hypothetical protein
MGEHSADQVIGKLTDILADIPADSPRALKLAEMIRGLQKSASWRHTKSRAGATEPKRAR